MTLGMCTDRCWMGVRRRGVTGGGFARVGVVGLARCVVPTVGRCWSLDVVNEVLVGLGFGAFEVYQVGAWFRVPEATVRKTGSGTFFAPAKALELRGGRRVVQASSWGPNLVHFARSASVRGDYRHEAHDHRFGVPVLLHRQGRVGRQSACQCGCSGVVAR